MSSVRRYFHCPSGKGLFVKEKWVRRSFLQRPRGPYGRPSGQDGEGEAP